MNGIRFKNRSSFTECFSGIYKSLEGNSWLFEEGSLELCNEDDLELITYSTWYAAFSDPFPDFGGKVKEDWNSLLTFKMTGSELAKWVKEFEEDVDRIGHISNYCEAYFLNIDAAFWVIFTNNQNLLLELKASPHFMEECNINEYSTMV